MAGNRVADLVPVVESSETTAYEQWMLINNDLTNIQSEMEIKKAKYTEKYGSEAYWLAGFILEEVVRVYSIPVCFIGIAIGAVFQYAMGTRRLDYKHRGFGLIITFVTILVICQVLPFIYAIVVVGWRG